MGRFLKVALLFYVVATTLGVVLRWAVAAPVEGLTFVNALHAHSHTLYFGWAALGLLTLFFARLGVADRMVHGVLWAVVALSAATFVAFLHSGYARPGVIVSASSLVVWAAVVALFLWRARGRIEPDVPFLRAAVVYIFLAGSSAAARVALLINHVEDPLLGRLAVFGFLHCFATFFTFGVMGLVIHRLEAAGVSMDARRLRLQWWLSAPIAWLTFPLGVSGGMSSALGPIARVAALALLVPTALWLTQLWRAARRLSGSARGALLAVGAWWLIKAGLELAGALGLAEAAADARHPVILYLHVTLLGVVSAALLWLVAQHQGREVGWPLVVHHAGVAVMALGLGAASAPWLGTLAWGLWLAVVGGVLVVGAGVTVAMSTWLGAAGVSASPVPRERSR